MLIKFTEWTKIPMTAKILFLLIASFLLIGCDLPKLFQEEEKREVANEEKNFHPTKKDTPKKDTPKKDTKPDKSAQLWIETIPSKAKKAKDVPPAARQTETVLKEGAPPAAGVAAKPK